MSKALFQVWIQMKGILMVKYFADSCLNTPGEKVMSHLANGMIKAVLGKLNQGGYNCRSQSILGL